MCYYLNVHFQGQRVKCSHSKGVGFKSSELVHYNIRVMVPEDEGTKTLNCKHGTVLYPRRLAYSVLRLFQMNEQNGSKSYTDTLYLKYIPILTAISNYDT